MSNFGQDFVPYGYTTIPVHRDGDCAYQALLACMHAQNMNHSWNVQQLRDKFFVSFDSRKASLMAEGRLLAAQVELHRTHDFWNNEVGDFVMSILADVLNCTICVYTTKTLSQHFEPTNPTRKPPKFTVMHQKFHYTALIRTTSPSDVTTIQPNPPAVLSLLPPSTPSTPPLDRSYLSSLVMNNKTKKTLKPLTIPDSLVLVPIVGDGSCAYRACLTCMEKQGLNPQYTVQQLRETFVATFVSMKKSWPDLGVRVEVTEEMVMQHLRHNHWADDTGDFVMYTLANILDCSIIVHELFFIETYHPSDMTNKTPQLNVYHRDNHFSALIPSGRPVVPSVVPSAVPTTTLSDLPRNKKCKGCRNPYLPPVVGSPEPDYNRYQYCGKSCSERYRQCQCCFKHYVLPVVSPSAHTYDVSKFCRDQCSKSKFIAPPVEFLAQVEAKHDEMLIKAANPNTTKLLAHQWEQYSTFLHRWSDGHEREKLY